MRWLLNKVYCLHDNGSTKTFFYLRLSRILSYRMMKELTFHLISISPSATLIVKVVRLIN